MAVALQESLPGIGFSKPTSYLVLAIHKQHADRIFAGEKEFELRKVLPREPFGTVFLYESGGAGIVGWFESGEVLRDDVEKLWRRVGERATSRERFFRYFAGRSTGCAITIRQPFRLDEAVSPQALRTHVPTFSAPMSFLNVKAGSELHEALSHLRQEAEAGDRVRLRPLTGVEHRERFVEVVTDFISRRYDEITRAFAESILASHDRGSDPNGLFTTRKIAYVIEDRTAHPLGYTTLTLKRGGCAKTGPTILEDSYRGVGLGPEVRSSIHLVARRLGVRKVYCTAADTAREVVSYLLKSRYQVEAHLRLQYTQSNGELIFGYFLDSPTRTVSTPARIHSRSGRVVENTSATKQARSQFRRIFSNYWMPIDVDVADRLLGTGKADAAYESKPTEWLGMYSSKELVGASILVPKRGGSVKVMLTSSTAHTPSMRRLVDASLARAKSAGRRKVYAPVNVDDAHLASVLRGSDFVTEGILRSPYVQGRDMILMSRLL